MSKNVAAIICAAGASSRFGGKKKKPFVEVAGRAAFLRSVELFNERADVKQVLLAISEEDREMVEVSWGANLKFFGVQICIGGAQRFETVSKALALVRDDIDIVAVHDAARCCVTAEWIDGCLKKAFETGAAMLACPVVATIKNVKDGVIVGTVDRAGLYEAQTPQIFSAELLRKAYSNIGKVDKSKISDDSQLVEAAGHKVAIVETDSSNVKITNQCDVAIATAIIKEREKHVKPKGYESPFSEAIW